jgi:hypothetical protein
MNMQNFDDLKGLWQKGNEKNLPASKDILSAITKSRKKMLRRNTLAILSLGLTFAFITWIGTHYDFRLVTTKIGIVLTLISIVMGVFFNTKLANLLKKQNDPTLSNHAFLQQLIEYRNVQRIFQTKGISLYFFLLTIGIMLYMFEFAVRDLTFGIIVYCITLGWIAFNWFYLRKKAIRKYEIEINEQINNIEKLINKINQEEN